MNVNYKNEVVAKNMIKIYFDQLRDIYNYNL